MKVSPDSSILAYSNSSPTNGGTGVIKINATSGLYMSSL